MAHKDEYAHWQVEWQPWARKYAISEPLEFDYVIAGLEEQLFTLPEAFNWIERFYRDQDAQVLADMQAEQQENFAAVEAERGLDFDYERVPSETVQRPGGLAHQVVSEPPRVLTGNDLVMNPIASQGPVSRQSRLEEYKARVGLQ